MPMKNFYVYILKCNDGSYYTGHTDDLENRIAFHNSLDNTSYTATRLPFKLVYVQEFMTRGEAIDAEHQIKRWSRKKKQTLIDGKWDDLNKFSRKPKNTYFDFIE
jgi:predicted GIY-YIG superfamily endonuclease